MGATKTASLRRIAAEEADLAHLVCCDPDLTRCGLDASAMAWDAERPTDCLVCLDLQGPCWLECPW